MKGSSTLLNGYIRGIRSCSVPDLDVQTGIMTEAAENAAKQLALALRALHERAGNPTYDALIRHGRNRTPAAAFTPQSLSDWRSGRSVPSSEPDFRVLVQILEQLALQRDPEFRRQPPAAWDALRDAAWQERHSNPGGRPRHEPDFDPGAAASPDPRRETDPAGRSDHELGGLNVHLYGARGTQIGDGNTQNNTFN